jgi:hypothetical protein
MRIHVTFIGLGQTFLVLGIAFGVWLGASKNFSYADAHAHWNLLGCVVPTLYGLIHRAYPKLVLSRLAWPQLIGYFLGVLIFVPGLVVEINTGSPAVLIPGAILILLSTLTFLFLLLTGDHT